MAFKYRKFYAELWMVMHHHAEMNTITFYKDMIVHIRFNYRQNNKGNISFQFHHTMSCIFATGYIVQTQGTTLLCPIVIFKDSVRYVVKSPVYKFFLDNSFDLVKEYPRGNLRTSRPNNFREYSLNYAQSTRTLHLLPWKTGLVYVS